VLVGAAQRVGRRDQTKKGRKEGRKKEIKNERKKERKKKEKVQSMWCASGLSLLLF
jgi:hypothetical protein